MAISKIQYDDKVAINIDSTIPDINKCNASDLNEIKSVVNNNADEIPTISDEYGTSTADGYSQNYINENTINSSGEPSTSEEDVSSATFTNTLEAPMNIDLKGNTLQNGTPTPSSPIPINNVSGDNDIVVCGKNIWIPTLTNGGTNISPTNCTATLNNDEYTFTATGSDMQFGQIAPKNNNYTNSLGTLYEVKNASSIGILLTNTNFTRNYITFYNSNKVSLGYTRIDSNTGLVNVPSSATYFSWRIGMLGATSGTTYKTKVMVSYNEIPTTYEAYNGTTYNIDLPVENLFDKDNAGIGYRIGGDGANYTDANYFTSEYIKVEPNTTYTIKKDSVSQYNAVALYTQNKGFISRSEFYTTTTYTFTTNTNTYYIRVCDTNDNINSLKVGNGTEITNYSIELNKIGTYQDYFYKENDKWYLHKEIGKVVLNGSEAGWNVDNPQQRVVFSNIASLIKTPANDDTAFLGLCNKLVVKSLSEVYVSKMQGVACSTGGNLSLHITGTTDTGSLTLQQWKTWLSSNNIIVDYVLKKPTNTLITYTPLIEQLESIKNAMSKEGTTNVNQVNNDVPFILDLSVFNDTYNGRYESLVEQIPSKDNLVNVGTYVNDNYKVNMLYSHNLFDGTLYNGIINQSGTYISNANRITNANSTTMKTFILKKGTYTLSIDGLDACTIVLKNESGSVIQEFADSWKTLPFTFTTTNDGYFYFSAKKNDDSALTPSDYKLMLNEGSEALPYEPYIVPSINVDGEEIYNANIGKYSTNEINTGMKWIDGKDIYRKVFTFTINDAIYTYTTDITTANVSDIWINANSYGIQSATSISPANSYHANNIYATGMTIDKTQANIRIYVRNGSARNDLSYKVILEYTKTS